jgi:glucosamine--fructose-6-phosphate aminotransferase (isomerizing)
MQGQFTLQEIESQPTAWAATIDILRDHAAQLAGHFGPHYQSVLFTGCGSPYYLALSAAAMFQELSGVPARAVPASELWLNTKTALPAEGKVLLVVFSRSGETSEAIHAVETFRATGRGEVIIFTSYPGRPLNELADFHLTLPDGQERSLAQTRAFSTLFLAALACATLWSGRSDLFDALGSLPEAAAQLLGRYSPLAKTLGTDPAIDRFYFLGSGARYGLASELALKMKEMSLSHSEPFHFLEYRHGPKSMASPSALVLGLLSETSRSYESAVLSDIRALGARTLALGTGDADVSLSPQLHELVAGPLFLPIGQLIGYWRALHNGCDPDEPHNLTAVVML